MIAAAFIIGGFILFLKEDLQGLGLVIIIATLVVHLL